MANGTLTEADMISLAVEFIVPHHVSNYHDSLKQKHQGQKSSQGQSLSY